MGDLNKYLPHEALNVTSLGAQTKWDVQTRQSFDEVDTGDLKSRSKTNKNNRSY